MVKILLLNVGTKNKGNRALIYSTRKSLESNLSEVTYIYMGPEDSNRYGEKIIRQAGWSLSIQKPQYTLVSFAALIQSILILGFKKMGVTLKVNKNSVLYPYSECDIAINSGGDSLSGENGIGTLEAFINIWICKNLSKPVILYGESLGFFKSPFMDRFARYILNKVDIIILREELSQKYLNSNKICKPEVFVTADPAFLLPACSKERVKEILQQEKIPDLHSPIIGINPSGLISRYMGMQIQKADEQISKVFAQIIDRLTEELNANVLLIPHVYTPTIDDRNAINDILDHIQNKEHVFSIKNEYEPQDLKGLIGICDLFIGMRMHATIASTSLAIPTIGIAYSHKMHGIVGKMLGLDRYIIDIQNVGYDDLLTTINRAWVDRHSIKQKLEEAIPEIRKKSQESGIITANFIKAHCNLTTSAEDMK